MNVSAPCHDTGMNGATYLIIGLIAGLALGLLIGALRIKAEREKVVAESGKVALLNTQLEAMREEENRLTTLNEQLRAVTTGMTQLTTQAQEAELKRTRAESEMRTQIENMKLGNETLLRETTKLAGALSNSQTRGKYGVTGTGRQFLNGSAVTLAALKELGDRLVDLHGPHDHQTLLSPVAQREALDGFGGLQKLVGEVRQAWKEKREAEEAQRIFKVKLAGADGATRESIDHQVKELEDAKLVVGEDEQLERDYAAAGHGRRILELAGEVSGLLEGGEENVLEKLGKVQKGLAEWERLDGAAGELREKNELAVATLRELVREGERRAEEVGLDGERLAALEARLNCVLGLRRKYGGSLEAVLEKFSELKKRQWDLANAEGTEKELALVVKRAEEKYRLLVGKLGKGREKAAPLFAREVTEQLRGLGFQQSRLEVVVQKVESPGVEGGETVEMMFAPNPGEPPRPLRAIASSGELARVMLGMKTVLAERDEVPILIFDEVDANVGGETAKAVAMRLAGLGKTHQVLCLTHLPAVPSVRARAPVRSLDMDSFLLRV